MKVFSEQLNSKETTLGFTLLVKCYILVFVKWQWERAGWDGDL